MTTLEISMIKDKDKKHSYNFTYLMKFLEGVFVTDITAFVDLEHFVVEVRNLMPEAFAAYLVAMDLAAVVNPIAVAIAQAEIESVASIAAVEPVAVTAAFEIVTNLMHFAAVAAASIVVAHVQSAGLSACPSCQIEIQGPAVAVTRGHYSPTVDVYLIGYFADLLTAAAAAAADLKDYSAAQVTSVVAANHQHYFVTQASAYVGCLLHLPAAP